MTILITGANGNVGWCVTALLAHRRPRVMVRGPHEFPSGVDIRYGDFDYPETWPEVLDGVHSVYLYPFAGADFVAAARKAGVRRFVVHSAAAAGFTIDYDGTALARHLAEERDGHRAVETAVEASGAEWTHLRPGLLATNTLGWAEAIRTERVVREPYPGSGYPLVHEADIAEIAVAALLTDEHVGAAYTLTGPAKVTQAEQVAAIGAAVGAEIGFEELTPEQAVGKWRGENWPEEDMQWHVELLADAVDGPGSLPVSGTFEKLTGRLPRSFAQWARDHAADFS
nr:NAD(P)H-binding protein [Kibdelosporangium sp. MJ126-NF4]CEL20271.1 Oxidoreductase [Kibdelosporangium sp. MJ126-NF4]